MGIPKDLLATEDDWIDDDSIYSEDARVLLLEEDGITPEESAFMKGYEEAG